MAGFRPQLHVDLREPHPRLSGPIHIVEVSIDPVVSVSVADWMQIAVTAALTVTGLWLANSLSRKTRAERQVAVINKRFEVYPELWKATAGAAPMDEVIGGPALNQDQRDPIRSDGGVVLGKGRGHGPR